jgi:imidazoleglycerol-phosphate dehydratase
MSSPRTASLRSSNPRTTKLSRATSESTIELSLNLDGTGTSSIDTTVPFFDHLLTAFSKHSLVDLTVKASGDTEIDAHHTVEDTGIVLGKAIKEALGDKAGISRYGDAVVPLDEALVQAVVDLSGRPYLVHSGEPAGFAHHRIGGHFTGSLVRHVFESIAYNAGITVHITVLGGRDPHHIAEAEFKAFARAFRSAVEPDPRVTGVPSTKGAL